MVSAHVLDPSMISLYNDSNVDRTDSAVADHQTISKKTKVRPSHSEKNTKSTSYEKIIII
jgi:hypothetical protein